MSLPGRAKGLAIKLAERRLSFGYRSVSNFVLRDARLRAPIESCSSTYNPEAGGKQVGASEVPLPDHSMRFPFRTVVLRY
jgi:hypothetical protein